MRSGSTRTRSRTSRSTRKQPEPAVPAACELLRTGSSSPTTPFELARDPALKGSPYTRAASTGSAPKGGTRIGAYPSWIARAVRVISVTTRTLAEPKTERSRRTLMLPAIVLAALREQRRAQLAERLAAGSRWADNDYVFATHEGRPLMARNVRRGLRRRLRYAGLPMTRFHDLRHAFATMMLEDGEELAVISKALGIRTSRRRRTFTRTSRPPCSSGRPLAWMRCWPVTGGRRETDRWYDGWYSARRDPRRIVRRPSFRA
jgi:integrase-like protein